MLSLPTFHVLSQRLIPLVVAAFLSLYPLQAAITAGGLAVIGFTDTGDNGGLNPTDEFVLVVTESIAAGEVVYFTNTGWSNSGGSSKFYGVGGGPGSESGSQQLMRLTIHTALTPGTLISTSMTSDPAFTWKTSGSITGSGGSASYRKLDLIDTDGGFPAGFYGDQIYVFQSTNPFDPTGAAAADLSFIYLLDNGEYLANGFQNPSDGYLGANIPDASNVGQGLSENDDTAVELSPPTAVPGGFHTGSFGLNMSASAIVALQNNGGTKAQWLEAIANPENWASGSLPTQALTVAGVPEPSRVVLIMGAFGVIILRRRRRPWR